MPTSSAHSPRRHLQLGKPGGPRGHSGTGKVIETGGSDDSDHAYEVDVLLPNGEDVTIELDENYKVTEIDR